MAEEQELLQDAQKNLSGLYGKPVTVQADRFFRDKETVQLAGFLFQVRIRRDIRLADAAITAQRSRCCFQEIHCFMAASAGQIFRRAAWGCCMIPFTGSSLCWPTETTVYPGHGETTEYCIRKAVQSVLGENKMIISRIRQIRRFNMMYIRW